jgi:hypothetical protein
MAFKKAPEQDTYSTVEFPIFGGNNQRGFPGTLGTDDTAKDFRIVNLILERETNTITKEQNYSFITRPGTKTALTAPISGGVTSTIHAMYWWGSASTNGRLIIVSADSTSSPADLDIHSYDPPASATDSTWQLNTTYDKAFPSGIVVDATAGLVKTKISFAEFQYDSGAVDLVISDEIGGKLVKITQAGALTTCADADYPAGLIDIKHIDGYLVGIKPGTADIYNSDLNNPFSWTAGNFISAEQYGDTAKALGTHHNYIVIFGTQSIEFLYDAGIATGSPFQRNVSYSKQIGYVGGLAQHGDQLFFLGQARDGSVDLYVMENTDVKAVGGGLAQQVLMQFFYGADDAFSLDPYVMTCTIVNCPKTGHNFYSLSYVPPTGAKSFVFDLKTFVWSEWKYSNNPSWGIRYSASFQTVYPLRHFSLVLARETNTSILTFDPSLFQDVGATLTWNLQTDLQDFGTINQKSMHRLSFYTDKPTTSRTVSIQWTDDDYQNYNTAVTVDLNQELPAIRRLGRFRRRALKLTGTFNDDFRLFKIECDINKGGH